MEPQWLKWARELQAISQSGLAYASKKPFDAERYRRVGEIAAEMLSSSSVLDKEAFLELFQGEEGYATPKVDVRGVLFREGKLLLVKETNDGCWSLPGGWADINDSPRQAVVREVWEESGYETKAVKLLAVLDRGKQGHVPLSPFHVYKLFILCELIGGEAKTSFETSAVGFFGENELPELSLSRVTPKQITRLFQHLRHPHWPTDLD